MNELRQEEIRNSRLLSTKIIIVALVGGAAITSGIMVVLHLTAFEGKPLAPDLPKIGGSSVLLLVALAAMVVSLSTAVFLPSTLRQQMIGELATYRSPTPESDEAVMLSKWQVIALLRSALLEGSVILCSIFFLVSGEWPIIALGGVLLLVLIATIPSENGLRRWLSMADEELQLKRSGAIE